MNDQRAGPINEKAKSRNEQTHQFDFEIVSRFEASDFGVSQKVQGLAEFSLAIEEGRAIIQHSGTASEKGLTQ